MNSKDKVDIEFLYWSFVNLAPNLTGEQGAVGPESWNSDEDPHVGGKKRGVIKYSDFEKAIQDVFDQKPTIEIFNYIKNKYNEVLEKRELNPNTPGEIRLEELLEFQKTSKNPKIAKLARERAKKDVETFIKTQTEARKIAEAAQEFANKRPGNFTNFVPENIYVKPKDDKFVETAQISEGAAQNLLKHIQDAQSDPNAKAVEIRNAIAEKISAENPSLDKNAVEEAADYAARNAVSVLLNIQASDINEAINTAKKSGAKVQIPFFDPLNIIRPLASNTDLEGLIQDSKLRDQFIKYTSNLLFEAERSEEAIGTISETYFGHEITRIIYPTLNTKRDMPEFEVSKEETESLGKIKVKELERFATMQYLVTEAFGAQGLSYNKEQVDTIVIAINNRLKLNDYISSTLKNDLTDALDIRTSEIVAEIKARNETIKAVEETVRLLSLGESIEVAVISATTEKPPAVSFSTTGGLKVNFLGIFKSIGGEVVKRTIGKEFTKKAAAFVVTKIGGKLAISTVGGPAAHVIAAALFIVDLLRSFISKISIWIKKRPEILAVPVVIVGFVMGIPGIILGGIGGGLVLAAGGPKAALATIGGGIAKIAGTFTSIVIAASVGPVIAVLVGTPLLVALIYLIITNSAYVVPPGKKVLIGSEIVTSPYISVVKTPTPAGPFQNSDLPLTITYTVTITAKQGVLTNISIDYKCGVIRDGPQINCPATTPFIPEGITIPESISPENPFVFSYSVTYTAPEYQDSLITDTITVIADAPGHPGETAAGSATIKIGEPPEECPQGWPILPEGGESTLTITQGPHGGFSHSTIEAIDVGATVGHTITARHSGTAFVVYTSGAYNPMYIDVHSTCNGVAFTSRYAHLSVAQITNGQAVTMGQVIGKSGTNGTGPHLHYEFRGIPMQPPYIPKVVPDGCSNNCGFIP